MASATECPSGSSSQAATPKSKRDSCCFYCGNEGHWVYNCPFKTCSSAFSPYGLKGQGAGSPCKWSDELTVTVSKPKRACPPPPICRCGAAKCQLIRDQTDHRDYFVCPIRKGHGACTFRLGVGLDDTKPVNADLNIPKRKNSDSPVMDNPDPTCDPSIEREEHGDILDLDMGVGDSTMEKGLRLSRFISDSEAIHRRQSEFLRQIYAADAEDAFTTDFIQQTMGLRILGWLGRLAFPPSGSLQLPQARPFFCCVFPSFNPVCVPKDVDAFHGRPLDAEPDSPLQIMSQDSESGVLSELSSIQSVPGIGQGRDFMGPISKALVEAGLHIRNQLLTILESTEPRHHSSMTEAANKTFVALKLLSIDHRSFSERVRNFISCASSLAEIEEYSISTKMKGQGELSPKEIVKRYDNERANFEKISGMHAQTADAIRASETRLQSLGEEALRLKEKLLQIEDELRHCETENVELKNRLGKISEDMLESGKTLQEAEAEKKLLEQRSAAKEALQRARLQLRR